MIIAIDFDGTCVTHMYPYVGEEIGAPYVLQELINSGHKLVLNTMRSGHELSEAVEWFEKHNLKLYGVNGTPGQKRWTMSPKVYANLYIDDANLGCPLIKDHVDWEAVAKELVDRKLITMDQFLKISDKLVTLFK